MKKNNGHRFATAQRREGMRQMCLYQLRRLGGRATARELAAAVGFELRTIWPRLTELKAAGKIRDTGLKVGTNGRPLAIYADTATTTPATDALILDEAPKLASEADAPAWFKNFGV